MLKIKLRNGHQKETDYVYKWAMECWGRSIEFGISKKEFSTVREKTRVILTAPKRFKSYVDSWRNKLESKNIVLAKDITPHGSKKNSSEEKEAALN